MREVMTKSMARNIFYGGSLFFILIFVGLTIQSHLYIVEVSTDKQALTENVARGKRVWERNSCVNCHTILGEGAYFAPELGNVWTRYGGREDADGARVALKAWMQSQPTGIEGRRQMPQFNLTEQELDDVVDFFKWVDSMKNQNWPPNEAG
jgi:nitric oxide reductase subunit C